MRVNREFVRAAMSGTYCVVTRTFTQDARKAIPTKITQPKNPEHPQPNRQFTLPPVNKDIPRVPDNNDISHVIRDETPQPDLGRDLILHDQANALPPIKVVNASEDQMAKASKENAKKSKQPQKQAPKELHVAPKQNRGLFWSTEKNAEVSNSAGNDGEGFLQGAINIISEMIF